MSDREMNGEPHSPNNDAVETVARLIEQSSFGSPGMRQLRDRTSDLTAARIRAQAYFRSSPEGCEWWDQHHNDAAALYSAAIERAAGDSDDQEIGRVLLRLTHSLIDADESSDCPAGSVLDQSESATSGGRERSRMVMTYPTGTGTIGRFGLGSTSSWRSFECFYHRYMDELTVAVMEETYLRRERSRQIALEAMKAAFDRWDIVEASGRPEEWVLGWVLRRKRPLRNIIAIVPCTADEPPEADLDSPTGETPFEIRLAGAMIAEARRQTDPAIAPFCPADRMSVECLTDQKPEQMSRLMDSIGAADVNDALRRLRTFQCRSLSRLTTLLVRDVNIAVQITQDALLAANRAWIPGINDAEVATYLRRDVVNRSRAALRYRQYELEMRIEPLHDPEMPGRENQLPERTAFVTLLQRLPVRQREALVLHYYADLSKTQIADAMGISTDAARSHLQFGTEILKELFDRADAGGPSSREPGDTRDESTTDLRWTRC